MHGPETSKQLTIARQILRLGSCSIVVVPAIYFSTSLEWEKQLEFSGEVELYRILPVRASNA